LYQQGYQRQDVINLFRFIDWLMSLPKNLEQEFWREIRQLEEETRMPYITSVERLGIEQGIEQGMQLRGSHPGITPTKPPSRSSYNQCRETDTSIIC
jgi:hypothetical protein